MTGTLTLGTDNIQNLKFNNFKQIKNYLEQNGGFEFQGIIYLSKKQWDNIDEDVKNNLKDFQTNIQFVENLEPEYIIALKQNILFDKNSKKLLNIYNKLIKDIT